MLVALRHVNQRWIITEQECRRAGFLIRPAARMRTDAPWGDRRTPPCDLPPVRRARARKHPAGPCSMRMSTHRAKLGARGRSPLEWFMPDAAQFTRARFDNTGLGTSMQAPARFLAGDAADLHDADAAAPVREPGPIANGSNYVLDGDRGGPPARGTTSRRSACRREVEVAVRRRLRSRRNCSASWGAVRRSSPSTAFRCPEQQDNATGGQRSAMISPRR
jgi:hypothetical protein